MSRRLLFTILFATLCLTPLTAFAGFGNDHRSCADSNDRERIARGRQSDHTVTIINLNERHNPRRDALRADMYRHRHADGWRDDPYVDRERHDRRSYREAVEPRHRGFRHRDRHMHAEAPRRYEQRVGIPMVFPDPRLLIPVVVPKIHIDFK